MSLQFQLSVRPPLEHGNEPSANDSGHDHRDYPTEDGGKGQRKVREEHRDETGGMDKRASTAVVCSPLQAASLGSWLP